MPYAPHSVCLLRDTRLIWLMNVSNGLVALSYYIIPICLVVLMLSLLTSEPTRRRMRYAMEDALVSPEALMRTLRQTALFLALFALFIVLCGSTHVLDIVVLYTPIYWQQAILILLTGIVSFVTAALLVWTMLRLIFPPRHRTIPRSVLDGRSERH